jgi:CubicO group peptidase (beta-lactamase class C family)
MVARLVDQGRIRYEDPVTSVWPEFGAHGKDRLNIAQLLSHQAGVSGFAEPIDPALWFDWNGMCAHLAAMEPLWPPGSASGYHGMTYGNLAGEIFRRVDGRTIGTAFREDVATPFGLDLWIGLPRSEHGRLAQIEKPRALPDFGAVTPVKQVTMMVPYGGPSTRDEAAYFTAEFPAANGVGTALALARMMGNVVSGGGLLSQGAIEKLRSERIRGDDLVLPYDMSWGAGVMRNGADPYYGPSPRTFGHTGWGGSCAFGDPDLRLGCAYVMNRQQAYLANDPRAVALIKAAYSAL